MKAKGTSDQVAGSGVKIFVFRIERDVVELGIEWPGDLNKKLNIIIGLGKTGKPS